MRLIDADVYIEYCKKNWIPLNVNAVKAQPVVMNFDNDINAPTNGDTIYRQVIRKALWDAVDDINPGYYECNGIDADNIDKIVDSVPSAERTGHWIEIGENAHTYKCSECGRLLVNITDGENHVYEHYPYCHCGAHMI